MWRRSEGEAVARAQAEAAGRLSLADLAAAVVPPDLSDDDDSDTNKAVDTPPASAHCMSGGDAGDHEDTTPSVAGDHDDPTRAVSDSDSNDDNDSDADGDDLLDELHHEDTLSAARVARTDNTPDNTIAHPNDINETADVAPLASFRETWRAELQQEHGSSAIHDDSAFTGTSGYHVTIERGAAAAARGKVPWRVAADGSVAPRPLLASEAALPARGVYGTRLLRYHDQSVFYPAASMVQRHRIGTNSGEKRGGDEARESEASEGERGDRESEIEADRSVHDDGIATVSAATRNLCLLQLPVEVLRRVLRRVSVMDLTACAATCRTLHWAVAGVQHPWQHLRFGILEQQATDSFVQRTLREQARRGIPLLGLHLQDCSALSTETLACAVRDKSMLETIVLEGCEQLTDDGTDILLRAAHASVRRLEIVRCQGLTRDIVEAIASCTQLTTLALSHHFDLLDSDVVRLFTACPNLTDIQLTNCPALSAMPLVSLPTGVQRLRMENCPRVDDRLPQYLVPAVLQQLQLLSLTGCCNLTDDSMCVLVTELSRVADLSLRECYIITDASLQVLAISAPVLRTLDLGMCANVTDKGVLAVAAGCKRLEAVCLRECPLMTQAGITALQEAGIRVLRS